MTTIAKKDISDLKEELILTMLVIKTDKKIIRQIKNNLQKNKILAGEVQKWFKDPEKEVLELDKELEGREKLFFLVEQVYIASGNKDLDYREYFTEREIKEVRTTFRGHTDEIIKFPYTFKNVTKLHDGWSATITVTELRMLNNGAQIQYNPNAQRSSKLKTTASGQLIPDPKTYPKSLDEIENLFLKEELISSTLIFNARLGSADPEDEVFYDDDIRELTIAKGTLFDCLDGYHRFTATIRGQEKDKTKDMEFMIKIINTTDEKAAMHFTQTNTINVIRKSQKNRMDKGSFETYVVDFLKEHSDLKGRITSNELIPQQSDNLVTYSVLTDAIKDNFEIDNKAEAIKIAKYLNDFFKELCFNYPDEFLGENLETIKKESLINANIMFFGYVTIASRLLQNNTPIENFLNVMSKIDFSRSNPMWVSLNVITNDGNLKSASRKGIIEYFSTLEI